MTPEELKKLPKAGLIELARQKKIAVTTRMLKAELVKIIHKNLFGKKAAKTKARAKTGTKAKAGAQPSARARPAAKKKPKTRAASKASTTPKKKPAARKPRSKTPAARNIPEDTRTIRQKAVAGKYHLTTTPTLLPPVDSMEIPYSYNVTRIVAMVRDPNWIFAYWEVTGDTYHQLEKSFGDKWSGCRIILRVFDRTAASSDWFDIEPGYQSSSWYIHVASNRLYQVAIGVLDPEGKFTEIAISNLAETPNNSTSNIVDDKWLVPDTIYEKIFIASGGYEKQNGSAELIGLFEKQFIEQMGSESVSSFSSAELQKFRKQRGFRLWVETELILYGATEPDARVTVRGSEIKLRGDGTFSVRFALPDGTIDIPVTAESGDKREERTIEAAVNKKSKHRNPVIK